MLDQTCKIYTTLICVVSAIRRITDNWWETVYVYSSVGCHLIVVDGFECPSDPRSYAVRGSVTKGRQVLCEESDKVQAKDLSGLWAVKT